MDVDTLLRAHDPARRQPLPGPDSAEAISMYERAGYQAVDRYNDNPWATHFFEKKLT